MPFRTEFRRAGGALLAFAGLAACGGEPASAPAAAPPQPVRFAGRVPTLAAGPDALWLAWVEESAGAAGRTASLHLRAHRANGWEPPVEVARGTGWIVNWADFPEIDVAPDGTLFAHHRRRLDAGRYDYGVEFTLSRDGGRTWDPLRLLHDHDGPGEHGFVASAAHAGGFDVVWLDGRTMGTRGGTMQLRHRRVDAGGALGPERVLDERVCTCCQTDLVRTADGALLAAYRDEDEDRRDVRVLRFRPEDDAVTTVFDSADGWRIAGCPVNGPALAQQGAEVFLAWFTRGSDDVPHVRCARSRDGGATFAELADLAEGDALGRVDACFDGAGRVLVTWLRAGAEASWMTTWIEPDGTPSTRPWRAADAARASGFGRLERVGDRLWFAYTTLEGETEVRCEPVPPPGG